MSLILALDQGGHASRALLFDAHGRENARAVRTVAVRRVGDDRVEQDAEELVASLESAALEVLGCAQTIAVAGLATQRSSIVCWDRLTGLALGPVLSWQDRRAAAAMSALESRFAEIRGRTGLFASAHYGASKLRWCFDHWPQVRTAADAGRLACGPLASFLAWRLTRSDAASAMPEHLAKVDPANASRTLLWNLASRDWDDELLSWFGISRKVLPECVPTLSDLGPLRVAPTMRLRVLTGDQSAALYAFGAPSPDCLYVNLGTGAFAQRLLPAGVTAPARLPASVVLEDSSGIVQVSEGVVNGAGAALAGLAGESGVSLEDQLPLWLEQESEPSLFLNGVSGLGSPFWVPDYPSRFVGSSDLRARAVGLVESVLFLLRVNLEEMNATIPPPSRVVVTGGFATLDALGQRFANLTGIPVERPEQTEATARGVAWLATDHTAAWPAANVDRFEPCDDPRLQSRYRAWRELLDASLR